MLASFVLDPGRRSHAIDELARERLSLELRTYGDVAGRGRGERPVEAGAPGGPARGSPAATGGGAAPAGAGPPPARGTPSAPVGSNPPWWRRSPLPSHG